MVALIKSRLDLELENETLDSARRTRLQALADHYEGRIPKLRGLLVLTGGLPRFAHLLFDLLAETDLSSVAGTLSRFLDEQTPYFQSRLDPRLIPKAELEVLDAIASAAGPLTPKEVAARLRARSPNAVATCLKRLRERGLVKPTGPSRRDVRYDLTEPLFRVWRRFRRSRAERDQVVLLADFVAAMFDRPELEADWQGLMKTEAAGLRRSVVETALSLQGWKPPQPEFASILEGLPGPIKDLIERADQEYSIGTELKAFELLSEALVAVRREGSETSLTWLLNWFAAIANFAGQFEAGRQAAVEAEERSTREEEDLGLALATINRGYSHLGLGDNPQALEAFKIAEDLFLKNGHDLGHAHSLCGRGEVLLQLGDNSRALEAFKIAEDLLLKSGYDLGRGVCYFGFGRLEWAEGKWENGLDHLLTAHRLGLRRGREAAASTIWSYLGDVVSRMETGTLHRLLRRTEPLLIETGTDELARQQVIRFARGLLTAQGPELLLDILPILESGLP
jgi:tetratricopeptide (TPR) repeat protein